MLAPSPADRNVLKESAARRGKTSATLVDASPPQLVALRQMVRTALWDMNIKVLKVVELICVERDERLYRTARTQLLDLFNAQERSITSVLAALSQLEQGEVENG